MKFQQNRLLLALAAIILSISSCKKNDITVNSNQLKEKQIIEQFTKVPKDLNPTLQKIANRLKEKDEQTPFIVNVGNKVGTPFWSKALFKSRQISNAAAREMEAGDQAVLIPLSVPNSTEVGGFIAAVIDANNNVKSVSEYDKFNYYLLGFNKPTSEIDAEDVAMQCLILQKEVFGNAKFKILDNELFNTQDGSEAIRKNFEMYLSEIPQTTQSSSRIVIIKHNHCTGHTGTGPNGHEGGDCDECDDCGMFEYTLLFFESPFDWGGGGFGGGGSDGGEGGGGGGWTPPSPSPLEIHKNLITTQLNAINPNASFYFNDALDPNMCQSFNTVADFASYLDGSTTFDQPVQVSQTGNEKVSKARVWRTTGGYDFFVKTEKDAAGKYSVKDITASEFGITFSWSFTLTTYSSAILKPFTNPNDITIDVYGTENYNIFLEGIGTVYKSPVHYQIVVNAVTGEITSIKKV